MSTSTPDNQLNPEFAKLELTGVTTIFNTVSGFSITWEVQAEPVAATDAGQPQKAYRSGAPTYGDLTCEAQLSKTDTSLFDWWEEVSKGELNPKEGTLTLLTPDGSPTAAFNIVGAVLTSLEVSGAGLSDPSAAGLTATLNCLSYTRQS